ncbi:MAG: hypothetical protein KDC03_11135 [Flavobacteriales bacterium]|nr:hypothetical protein [Flavobacteriales bacterium]
MQSPLLPLSACPGPGLNPGDPWWLDAIIDPLETRTWISMGIEAAKQAPATREFNMGVLQT